jgi:hypothetical protein
VLRPCVLSSLYAMHCICNLWSMQSRTSRPRRSSWKSVGWFKIKMGRGWGHTLTQTQLQYHKPTSFPKEVKEDSAAWHTPRAKASCCGGPVRSRDIYGGQRCSGVGFLCRFSFRLLHTHHNPSSRVAELSKDSDSNWQVDRSLWVGMCVATVTKWNPILGSDDLNQSNFGNNASKMSCQ